jgi:hypothetical protein
MAGITTITTSSKERKEGPAGPTGPTGPAGPQGPSGPAGPAGQTGTANVIYSDWLDVPFQVVKNSAGDTLSWQGIITATKLDANILSKGEIKVYVNLNTAASPTVVALPIDPFLWGIILSPVYQIGKITIVGDDDYGTFTDQGSKYFQYRYILIPGGTTARTSNAVNWNDYKSVQAYLGLKD